MALLLLGVLVLRAGGFEGISHDDAARSLLAVDFRASPRLDATRSSWLPAHTWLLGAALTILRPSRLWWVSLAGGLAACASLVALSRRRGLTGWALVISVALPLCWPWTVVASAAPGVPELPCVALVLGALVALERTTLAGDLTAGLLLTVACGHRYEAWWATAGVLAVLAHGRAWRRLGRVGIVALAIPALWLLMNHQRAGDALDFLHRVRAFREAEGALEPLWRRALRFPTLLGREAPWAYFGAAVTLATTRRLRPETAAALAVLAGLVSGELQGSGPTHHPERALLLPVWLLGPAAGVALGRLGGARGPLLALALAACWGAYPLRRARFTSVAPEAPAAGREVRRLLGGDRSRCWFVEAAWEEFLWVEHASEASRRAVPDRDYGGPAPSEDTALARLPACATVAAVTSERLRVALRGRQFRERWSHGGWTVLAR
ncbi:MAG: hypothetical protein HY909_06495 [Deltaproteobacteria bacterium]|nr:hypothetical protein [Deltaproteobacteria bacterium]